MSDVQIPPQHAPSIERLSEAQRDLVLRLLTDAGLFTDAAAVETARRALLPACSGDGSPGSVSGRWEDLEDDVILLVFSKLTSLRDQAVLAGCTTALAELLRSRITTARTALAAAAAQSIGVEDSSELRMPELPKGPKPKTRALERVTHLCTLIRHSAAMVTLELTSAAGIGSDGAISIASALKGNAVLTTLKLEFNLGRGNKTGAKGGVAIAEVLQFNSALTTLYMRSDIGPEGGVAIGRALEANTSLTDLDLSRNEIGDEGAVAVAAAIASNAVLVSLDLHGNKIGPVGGAAFAEALASNHALAKLRLDGFELHLAQLRGTDPVTSLDFSSERSYNYKPRYSTTYLGVASTIVIASLIENNAVLTTLNLSGNDLSASLRWIKPSDVQGESKELGAKVVYQGRELIVSHVCGDGDLELSDPSGVLALAKALETNATLTALDLHAANIGLGGTAAIAKALVTNAALTTLNLSGNEICSHDADVLAKALQTNATLTDLDLSGNCIGPDGASLIAETLEANSVVLPKLNLSGNQIGGLWCCTAGRILRDPSGVLALTKALETNATLTDLTLCGSEIRSDGVAGLGKALKTNLTLTTLDLSSSNGALDGDDSSFDDGAMMALATALGTNTVLVALNLSGNGISCYGAIALATALETNTVLTTLNLSGSGIGGPHGWIKLSDVQGESKEVGAKVDYQGREMTVGRVDSDGDLKLSDPSGVLALAKALEVNTALTALCLRKNTIGSIGATAFATALEKNAVLTELDLGEGEDSQRRFHNEIGSDGVSALCKALDVNKTLLMLTLDGAALDISQLRAPPARLCPTSDIGKPIGPRSGVIIGKCLEANTGVLTTLDLGDLYTKVDDWGAIAIAKALAFNPMLTDLNLKSGKIGSDGAAALANALATAPLNALNLSCNYIGCVGATALATALKTNTVLTSLDVCCNKIRSTGVTAIADALKGNAVLTTLNLSGNTIGGASCKPSDVLGESKEVGAKVVYQGREMIVSRVDSDGDLALSDPSGVLVLALAKALEVNATLTALNLSHNSIRCAGATAIGKSLKVNKVLAALDLSSNDLKAKGGKAIGNALKGHQALTELDLSFNRFPDSTVDAIAEALTSSGVLATLRLYDCGVGPKGAALLAKALAVNETLTTLDLSSNRNLGKEALDALESAKRPSLKLQHDHCGK